MADSPLAYQAAPLIYRRSLSFYSRFAAAAPAILFLITPISFMSIMSGTHTLYFFCAVRAMIYFNSGRRFARLMALAGSNKSYWILESADTLFPLQTAADVFVGVKSCDCSLIVQWAG